MHWTLAEYQRKVLIGGGKERLASLLTPEFIAAAGLPADAAGQQAAVASWHRRKTQIYTGFVGESETSCRARSRPQTSTCWPSSGWAWPPLRWWSWRTPATACWPPPGPGTSLDMAGTSITLSRLDPEIEGLLAAPAEIAIRTF